MVSKCGCHVIAEVSPELVAQGRRSVTVLQAANSAAGAAQRSAQCELACSRNGQQLWRDCLGSPALQLAGSQHFAAAALADGTLQVHMLTSWQGFCTPLSMHYVTTDKVAARVP